MTDELQERFERFRADRPARTYVLVRFERLWLTVRDGNFTRVCP
jgi:hypothetical protein